MLPGTLWLVGAGKALPWDSGCCSRARMKVLPAASAPFSEHGWTPADDCFWGVDKTARATCVADRQRFADAATGSQGVVTHSLFPEHANMLPLLQVASRGNSTMTRVPGNLAGSL